MNMSKRKDNQMKVLLSAWSDSETCVWCEKDRECVTATFGDGFMNETKLCWGCLAKAVKVRNRQAVEKQGEQAAKKDET